MATIFSNGIVRTTTTAKPLLVNVPTSFVPAPFARSRPSYRRLSSSPTNINHRVYLSSHPIISSLSSSGSRLQSRTFSTTMAAKKEFVVIIPDKPGAQQKRVAVRPTHLSGIKPLIEAGTLLDGGAIFHKHPVEGETPQFKGSALIVRAESVAEVKEFLNRDIYATEGVWDVERAEIIPFKSALRG